jgi:hypothetical protein
LSDWPSSCHALPNPCGNGAQHQQRESTGGEFKRRWTPKADQEAAGPHEFECARGASQAAKAKAPRVFYLGH